MSRPLLRGVGYFGRPVARKREAWRVGCSRCANTSAHAERGGGEGEGEGEPRGADRGGLAGGGGVCLLVHTIPSPGSNGTCPGCVGLGVGRWLPGSGCGRVVTVRGSKIAITGAGAWCAPGRGGVLVVGACGGGRGWGYALSVRRLGWGLVGARGGGVGWLVVALLPLGARGGAGGVALSSWWWGLGWWWRFPLGSVKGGVGVGGGWVWVWTIRVVAWGGWGFGFGWGLGFGLVGCLWWGLG